VEALEHPGALVLGYRGPVVVDLEDAPGAHAHGDAAALPLVAHGVVQQVVEQLAQARRIAANGRRLAAALEAEVKADADSKRVAKEAAVAKVREQRAQAEAERAELRDRQAALVTKKKRSPVDDLGGAMQLAGKANELKAELVKKPGKGEKSVVTPGKSGKKKMAAGVATVVAVAGATAGALMFWRSRKGGGEPSES
jgi:hypothetical protein